MFDEKISVIGWKYLDYEGNDVRPKKKTCGQDVDSAVTTE